MEKGVTQEEYQTYIKSLKEQLETKKAMYKIIETEILALEKMLNLQ